MPAEGVQLSPRNDLMSANEIHAISRMFVSLGVNKIRLTGGEPLLRKDFDLIFKNLNQLSAEIGLTTNGILVHKHIDLFKQVNLQNINLSIDTLNSRKFHEITRRNQFGQVMDNMHLLLNLGINPRLNVVLLKGFNDNEVVDFIQTTKDLDLTIRFIEFMPFEGNKWDKSKLVSLTEILERTATYFGAENIVRLNDKPNDTSKNFKIKGHKGSFSIISTVTHPFCDSCNRIRLTANGKLKNCLFSGSETDLLTQLRNGSNIETLIRQAILNKKAVRGGMRSLEEFSDPKLNQHNRSMILIGG
jgi:cyclic pyranopterin phosphate synthase